MQISKNEEGQFMLLAGFMIAIGLVITTVMLNSIIFEGNMAGETGTDPIKYDIANLISLSGNEMKSAYRNSTNMSIPRPDMINNFSKQIQNFNANLSKIYALHGEMIDVDSDISNWNNTRYANFTSDGTSNGASDWVVIKNVKKSNISVNITNTGTFLNISLKNSTGNNYWINSTSGPVSFYNNSTIGSPYEIWFHAGPNSAGTYKITGNTSNGKNFTRARDFVFNSTVTFSTGKVHSNITFPVTVPW